VWASSNGTLQFSSQQPAYENACLDGGPAPGMGDLIAPYWDDLDLRLEGFLEYETVGEAPNRIFVVEWDGVPHFEGPPTETFTFEVQLFEATQDIVFLYPDVTAATGAHGSSATIGLQSEAQGLALQYSCDQAAVATAGSLHFAHPAEPNDDVGLEERAAPVAVNSLQAAKGDAALLLQRLNEGGPAALPRLRAHWLSQPQPRLFSWQHATVDGTGEDLVALWRGPQRRPGLAALALFSPANAGGLLALTFYEPLATRTETAGRPELYKAADVTGDGLADVIVHDALTGRLFVLSAAGGELRLHRLPHTCTGALALRDVDGDGTRDILRGGCTEPRRVVYSWDGATFTLRPTR
jgi:hypothetical protein